ncbi:MAG TPA: DNA-binding transcriptional regulator GalS [Alteromonas sp.]|nr:DNA-binding transcriptional regulator GalS [Alteromonas sp.]|tara:strand:+ start:666 stop:1673 length:1008 start_codon:yes stop_codon:yes gene_type:complete
MITIKDIAEAANVSPATVSRVINNGPKVGPKTREHVKAVMDKMGYRPNINARALVTQKSTSLGLVLAELMDPFFATYADAIEKVARKANTQLLMSSGSVQADTELKAIETLLNHRVKAMVVHAKFLDDDTLIQLARQAPGFVLINRYIDAIKHRCVWLDNIAGGRMMAEHVLKLGHRKIAVISSDFAIEDRVQREQGIRESLAEWGIDLSDSQIVHAAPNQEGGEIAMRQLLAADARFTAILAYNDAMAAGTINTLYDHNLEVPGDVSVMGFDDVLQAQFCRPKLTTMNYPIEWMASQAASLALDYAQGKQPDTDVTYKYLPTIVARNSVARCIG